MTKKVEIGRLALRAEGEWWNAYWAPRQDTMDDAQLLGSLRLNLATDDFEVKQGFIDLMTKAFGNVVIDVTGQRPAWGAPEPAPERERSGRG